MSTLFPKMISVSELKREAAKLLQELQAGAAPIHITVHGRRRAVLLAEEQYETLLLGGRPTPQGGVAAEAVPAPYRAPRAAQAPRQAKPKPRVPSAQQSPAFARVWDNDEDDVYDDLAKRL